jgi:hypothetical protein
MAEPDDYPSMAEACAPSMPSKFPTGDVRIMCGSVLSLIALGPAPFISMERQTVSRTKDWHTCCGLCAASQE